MVKVNIQLQSELSLSLGGICIQNFKVISVTCHQQLLLKYKIFRCHYISLVLRKSLLTMQELPWPLSYGWESYGDTYKAIMTDELPAPVALIELSVCACKTNCVNNRCKCRKNKLQCADMCKYIDCANDDTQELILDELILLIHLILIKKMN